jgi:hypothetical protein
VAVLDKWLIFSIVGTALVLDKTHASRMFLWFPGIYMLLDGLISGMSKPQCNLVRNTCNNPEHRNNEG